MKSFSSFFFIVLTAAVATIIGSCLITSVSAAAIRPNTKTNNKNPHHQSILQSIRNREPEYYHHSSLGSSSTGNVQVIAKYMEDDLDGVSFTLRGTAPLSWNGTGVPMTKIAPNTFSAVFDISSVWGTLTNDTQWEMEVKVVGVGANNFVAWELGRNHRITVEKGDTNRQPKIVCPYFNTKTGQTQTINGVYSPQLNNTRDVWLYVPAQLVENSVCNNEVEVLLMHDGQNLQSLWNVNGHLDNLILTSDIPPILVVGPYNTGDARVYEYTYSCCKPSDPNCGQFTPNQCAGADKYLDFLDDTLLPEAQKYFPSVKFTLRNKGILGSSLGGSLSCYAGVTRPASWTRVGCMSSSFWWNAQDFLHTITPKLTPINAKTQTFYFDSGDSCFVPGDAVDDQPQTSAVATKFMTMFGGMRSEGKFEIGQNLFWYLQRGAWHFERFWNERFPTVIQYLYGRNMYLNNPGGG